MNKDVWHHNKNKKQKQKQKQKQKGKNKKRENDKGKLLARQSAPKISKLTKKKKLEYKKALRIKKVKNIEFRKNLPVVLSILPLSKDVDVDYFHSKIFQFQNETQRIEEEEKGIRTFNIPGPFFKNSKWSILPNLKNLNDPIEILNLVSATEVALLAASYVNGNVVVDEKGKEILSLIRGIGTPSISIVIQGVGNKNLKDKSEIIRKTKAALKNELPGELQIFVIYDKADRNEMLRLLSQKNVHIPVWRKERSSVLIENIKFIEEGDSFGACIEGFVRGSAISANQIVSINGFGDFQIEKIYNMSESGRGKAAEPVPEEQHQIIIENTAVADIQNDEKMSVKSAALTNKQTIMRRLPKGTSEYQASWYIDDTFFSSSEDDEEEEEEDDESKDEEMMDLEQARVAHSEADGKSDVEVHNEEMEDVDMSKQAELSKQDEEYPDEVDLEAKEKAREKFRSYRGLKSFVESKWNIEEDLPEYYTKIFSFENYQGTIKIVKKEIKTYSPLSIVASGNRVGIVLKNITKEMALGISQKLEAFRNGQSGPLLTFGLYRDETKMTLCTYYVKKASSFAEPLQSNQPLLLYTGIRVISSKPLYSTNQPNIDKHKLLNFLPSAAYAAASFYAPATFPPVHILAFSQSADGTGLKLAFTGLLQNCDPNRVILKRIVLTGHPAKVNKNTALVKGMFYNAADIQWFRPVELYTKQGKIGYITESQGEHGAMKCHFNTPLQQNDTVYLALYKRVFPEAPEDTESS